MGRVTWCSCLHCQEELLHGHQRDPGLYLENYLDKKGFFPPCCDAASFLLLKHRGCLQQKVQLDGRREDAHTGSWFRLCAMQLLTHLQLLTINFS